MMGVCLDFWNTPQIQRKKQAVGVPKVDTRGIRRKRKPLKKMVGAQGLEPPDLLRVKQTLQTFD
jgi:hypothetical protein